MENDLRAGTDQFDKFAKFDKFSKTLTHFVQQIMNSAYLVKAQNMIEITLMLSHTHTQEKHYKLASDHIINVPIGGKAFKTFAGVGIEANSIILVE